MIDKELREKIEARKDRQSERVKNTILGVLKSDELDQIVDRFIEKESHVQIFKTILYVVTILIAAAGFFSSWYATYESNKFQAQMAFNEQQAKHVRDEIQGKIMWMNRGIDAIMDMRTTRELIVINCRYHIPFTPQNQAKLRVLAEYKVIRAFSNSKPIFKSEELISAVRALNKFEESVPDVCAKNAPKDQAWLDHLRKITKIMEKSIAIDEKKLLQLKNNL